MDFEEIDRTLGSELAKGDIVRDESGSFHQITRLDNDEDDVMTFDTYNLSTGDEDAFIIDPDETVSIYRSY